MLVFERFWWRKAFSGCQSSAVRWLDFASMWHAVKGGPFGVLELATAVAGPAKRTLDLPGKRTSYKAVEVDKVRLQPWIQRFDLALGGLTWSTRWGDLVVLCRGGRRLLRTVNTDPVCRSAPRLLRPIARRIQKAAWRHFASQGREDVSARSGSRQSQAYRNDWRCA